MQKNTFKVVLRHIFLEGIFLNFIYLLLIMTIADLIKYIDFLKDRSNTLKQKVAQYETLRREQKILGTTEISKIVEQIDFTMNPVELMAEYDKNAKELRLAQQTLERFNHTTDTGFKAKY